VLLLIVACKLAVVTNGASALRSRASNRHKGLRPLAGDDDDDGEYDEYDDDQEFDDQEFDDEYQDEPEEERREEDFEEEEEQREPEEEEEETPRKAEVSVPKKDLDAASAKGPLVPTMPPSPAKLSAVIQMLSANRFYLFSGAGGLGLAFVFVVLFYFTAIDRKPEACKTVLYLLLGAPQILFSVLVLILFGISGTFVYLGVLLVHVLAVAATLSLYKFRGEDETINYSFNDPTNPKFLNDLFYGAYRFYVANADDNEESFNCQRLSLSTLAAMHVIPVLVFTAIKFVVWAVSHFVHASPWTLYHLDQRYVVSPAPTSERSQAVPLGSVFSMFSKTLGPTSKPVHPLEDDDEWTSPKVESHRPGMFEGGRGPAKEPKKSPLAVSSSSAIRSGLDRVCLASGIAIVAALLHLVF